MTTIPNWSAIIADLLARADAADQKHSELAALRPTLALKAVSGDKPAAKELERLNSEITAASTEASNLTAAILAAEAEQQQAQIVIASAQRQAKADRIDAAIIERESANAGMDAALEEFARSLQEWLASDNLLASAGVADRGARVHRMLTSGVWHWIHQVLSQAERNVWTQELTECFPLNMMREGRPFSADHGVINARTLSAELRS